MRSPPASSWCPPTECSPCFSSDRSRRTSACRPSAPCLTGAWSARARNRNGCKAAIDRLQIDTRAASELRRLSGGNQQKVVIARWLAAGFDTLLCFDPTRGIDIGTKRQIYALVRELAASGAAVLLFTSELPEIALTCDRTIVLFGGTCGGGNAGRAGGRGELAARRARACSSTRGGCMTAPAETKAMVLGGSLDTDERLHTRVVRLVRRNAALFGMPALLIAALAITVVIHPTFSDFDLESLALGALPLAFAAAAQAVVVIAGLSRHQRL